MIPVTQFPKCSPRADGFRSRESRGAGTFESLSISCERLRGVSGVYAIIHRDTGMIYVGSSNNIALRLAGHLCAARQGRGNNPLYRAIRALGASAFDLEILERCPYDLNKSREDFYIALLGATGANGLNVCSKSAAKYGTVVAESTRARLSAVNTGKTLSAEHRAKIGVSNRGKKRTEEYKISVAVMRFGTKQKVETRRKISASMRGRILRPEHCAKISIRNSRPIIQMNENGIMLATFPSAVAASRATGACIQQISKCCHEKARTSGGFRWAFDTH